MLESPFRSKSVREWETFCWLLQLKLHLLRVELRPPALITTNPHQNHQPASSARTPINPHHQSAKPPTLINHQLHSSTTTIHPPRTTDAHQTITTTTPKKKKQICIPVFDPQPTHSTSIKTSTNNDSINFGKEKI